MTVDREQIRRDYRAHAVIQQLVDAFDECERERDRLRDYESQTRSYLHKVDERDVEQAERQAHAEDLLRQASRLLRQAATSPRRRKL